MLPDGARERLLAAVNSARDAVTVTWLAHGGLRIGELCGLHLADLHLRQDAACGECATSPPGVNGPAGGSAAYGLVTVVIATSRQWD